MKRYLLRIVVMIIVGGGLLITACQKTDTTPPVLTLPGPATIYVSLNHRYSDNPATAVDNKDGNVDVTSDNGPTNPNVNLVGSYIIHYSAADNSGNIGTITRTIIVSNDAQKFAGNYSVNDNVIGNNTPNTGNYTYYVNVIASNTIDNQLFLSNISNLHVTDSAKVSGSNITLTPTEQQFLVNFISGTMSGSGTVGNSAITGLNYTIDYVAGGNDNGVSVWTKVN